MKRYAQLFSSHQTFILACIAMIAFAANSLLCRMALGPELIDAASFSAVRVISGALVLWLIVVLQRGKFSLARVDKRSAICLFIYIAFFSFAYLELSTGTGALILFGAVQLTMLFYAFRRGERFSPASWIGVLLAMGGLVYLVSPGLSAPDPLSALLMGIAGIAWGGYSLLGRGAANPLAATAENFILCVPLALIMWLLFHQNFQLTTMGVLYGIASGAIASGLGYAIWYAALTGLSASRASILQLSVPVIAALSGVIVLMEPVTMRLLIASIAILSGIALVLMQSTSKPSPKAE